PALSSFVMIWRPPISTLSPYTTLFRSHVLLQPVPLRTFLPTHYSERTDSETQRACSPSLGTPMRCRWYTERRSGAIGRATVAQCLEQPLCPLRLCGATARCVEST